MHSPIDPMNSTMASVGAEIGAVLDMGMNTSIMLQLDMLRLRGAMAVRLHGQFPSLGEADTMKV